LERLAGEAKQKMTNIAAVLVELFPPDSRGIETFDLSRSAPVSRWLPGIFTQLLGRNVAETAIA
jgi:hypothetical protein